MQVEAYRKTNLKRPTTLDIHRQSPASRGDYVWLSAAASSGDFVPFNGHPHPPSIEDPHRGVGQMDASVNVVVMATHHHGNDLAASRLVQPMPVLSAFAHVRPVTSSKTTTCDAEQQQQHKRSAKSERDRGHQRQQRRRTVDDVIVVRPEAKSDGRDGEESRTEDSRRADHLEKSLGTVARSVDSPKKAQTAGVRRSGIVPPNRLRCGSPMSTSAEANKKSGRQRCVERSMSLPPSREDNEYDEVKSNAVAPSNSAGAKPASAAAPAPSTTAVDGQQTLGDGGASSETTHVATTESKSSADDGKEEGAERCSKAAADVAASSSASDVDHESQSVSLFVSPNSTPSPYMDHISSLRRKHNVAASGVPPSASSNPAKSDEGSGGEGRKGEETRTGDDADCTESAAAAAAMLLEETDSFDVEPMPPMSFGVASIVRQHSWSSSNLIRSSSRSISGSLMVSRPSSRSAQTSPVVEVPTTSPAYFYGLRRSSAAELPLHDGDNHATMDYYAAGLTGSLDGRFRRRSEASVWRNSADDSADEGCSRASSTMTSPDRCDRSHWSQRILPTMNEVNFRFGDADDDDFISPNGHLAMAPCGVDDGDDVSSGYASIGDGIAGAASTRHRRQLPQPQRQQQQPTASCAPWQAMQRRFDEGLRAARQFVAYSGRMNRSVVVVVDVVSL